MSSEPIPRVFFRIPMGFIDLFGSAYALCYMFSVAPLGSPAISSLVPSAPTCFSVFTFSTPQIGVEGSWSGHVCSKAAARQLIQPVNLSVRPCTTVASLYHVPP